MCVIYVVKNERPTAEMLQLGYAKNDHAVGVAWRDVDPNDKSKTVVRFKKGNDITLEEAIELAATLPTPYVMHFRNPSGGTGNGSECAHPFPVEPNVPQMLEGYSPDGCLFHNGLWGNWKNNLMENVVRSRFKLPEGAWSDSRGLAWMAAHFGYGVLELIDEKVVVLTPDRIHIFNATHRDWEEVNGVLCSNTHWKPAVVHNPLPQHYQGQHGRHGGRGSHDLRPHRPGGTDGGTGTSQANRATGGSSAPVPFRGSAGAGASAEAPGGGPGSSQQEAVQEGAAEAGQEAREASSWARSINSKNFRRPSAGNEIGFVQKKCSGMPEGAACTKFNGFIKESGKWYCLDCWTREFAFNGDVNAIEAKLYCSSKCEVCPQQQQAQKILMDSTHKWICTSCWHTAGRPQVRQIMKSGDDRLDNKRISEARGLEIRQVM